MTGEEGWITARQAARAAPAPPAVALLGDAMLGRGLATELDRRPPESVWSAELRELVLACDVTICNLECCISARGAPTAAIAHKPFHFRAPPVAVRSLAALGVRVVSLANNHALDYGEEALADTLALLDRAGIAHAGAGAGPAAARRGAVVDARGHRLGLLALADHPREYAAHGSGLGIAQAELRLGLPRWAAAELERLGREADFVIAFPHWGPNMTASPARWQRRRAGDLLAAGAMLVAGHSAHIFHGVERHEGGLAAYDLGGALDDYAVDRELRNDLGLLAIWRPRGEPELELVGLRLSFARTALAVAGDADWIAARLARACAALGSEVERLGEQRFTVG